MAFIDLKPYQRFDTTSEADAVRLHMNEAPYDWPPELRAELMERLQSLPFRIYPEKQSQVSEKLALRLGAQKEDVLLGASSGALLELLTLLLEPGDAVAIPEPGFGLNAFLLSRRRLKATKVEVGSGFPLEAWFQALEEGVKQIWMALPNNPTGAWIPPEALEKFLEAASSRLVPPLVVLDEAYGEFAPLSARMIPERYPNVLLLRTFSKAMASATWRLGYFIGQREWIQSIAQLQLPYSLSGPALEALDLALNYMNFFQGEARRLQDRRNRLARALGVAPGFASFLYFPQGLPGDPGPGFRIRRFPESSAVRLSIGSEAEMELMARRLGFELEPPGKLHERTLILIGRRGCLQHIDIDGDVLSQSMEEGFESWISITGAARRTACFGESFGDADFNASDLLQRADAYRATRIVLLGLPKRSEALERARRIRPEVDWQFFALDPAILELPFLQLKDPSQSAAGLETIFQRIREAQRIPPGLDKHVVKSGLAAEREDQAPRTQAITLERCTRETQIRLSLDLDGGPVKVLTGLGFLDHMATLLAFHAGWGLDIKAVGDLEVDAHHLVEDLGLVLGSALRKLLGEGKGILRYGLAYVPMDEALARVVVDISGRPACHFTASLPALVLGNGFQSELGREFFVAFAQRAGITLHAELLHGKNVHHALEALFKGLGRALGQVVSPLRDGNLISSTKGSLLEEA